MPEDEGSGVSGLFTKTLVLAYEVKSYKSVFFIDFFLLLMLETFKAILIADSLYVACCPVSLCLRSQFHYESFWEPG